MLDWFFTLLSPPQWEILRNWLATIGGLAALLIAASTYRSNVKAKREEQARLVYGGGIRSVLHEAGETPSSIPGEPSSDLTNLLTPYEWEGAQVQYLVRVRNLSKEVIGPVRVTLIHSSGPDEREVRYDNLWTQIPHIEPESDYITAFIFPNYYGEGELPMFTTRLLYRDSSGQWWHRNEFELIERVHDDPHNYEMFPNAPLPHPRPTTLRVRWHRLKRRARGLSSTP